MPTISIHEEVAYNIAKKYKELDNADFYLGALAPDSVNLNGFAPKEIRWKTHVRDENLDCWLNNATEFYHDNKNKYNESFLLGYILHIITDIIHDKYFYWDLRTEMTKDKIKEEDQHPLIRNSMLEYGYQNEQDPFRIYIKELLENHTGYDIQNISKETMIAWKNHCFENHNFSGKENKYITKNHVLALTNKVEETFKVFIS